MQGACYRRAVRALGVISCLAFAGGLALAPGVAAADAFKKGPYLQDVTPHEISILWEGAAKSGQVTIESPGLAPRTLTAPASSFVALRVSGLEPSRRYRYAVELDGSRATGEFVTAPRPGASDGFSFVVFGDTRSNAAAHRNVVERIRREVPDFILHTGDLVNEGSVDADWQVFFDVERDILRENVMVAAIGNHDRARGKVDAFQRYFPPPVGAPPGGRYHAFTYGNARFLVLDSNLYNYALTDQTAWIERELAAAATDPQVRHIFVVMHHPPYSTALHGGNVELRDLWGAMFEKYRVRVVFSGHDHTYEHSFSRGVHYVVSGGGGAPLYPRMARSSAIDLAASRYFERTFHFVRIQVIGDFVEIAAIRDDGSLIESFSLGDVPSDLVAELPGAPLTAGVGSVAPSAPRALPQAGFAPGVDAGCATAPGRGRRSGGLGWALVLCVTASAVALRSRVDSPRPLR